MGPIIFSKAELWKMNKKQLKALTDYYGIGIPKREKKEVFVNALDDYYRPKHVVESNGVPMSVRVRRIKESNNES